MDIIFTLAIMVGPYQIKEVGPWPSLVASHDATCYGDTFVDSVLMLNHTTPPICLVDYIIIMWLHTNSRDPMTTLSFSEVHFTTFKSRWIECVVNDPLLDEPHLNSQFAAHIHLTSFRCIIVFCGTDNSPHNIPQIQTKYENILWNDAIRT